MMELSNKFLYWRKYSHTNFVGQQNFIS